MPTLYSRLQPVLLIAAVACAAFLLGERWHAPITVQAASSDPIFQLSGIGPGTAISYYSASDHSIYIYQGATTGSSVVACSYKFILDEAGKPLRRENCPVHFGR